MKGCRNEQFENKAAKTLKINLIIRGTSTDGIFTNGY